MLAQPRSLYLPEVVCVSFRRCPNTGVEMESASIGGKADFRLFVFVNSAAAEASSHRISSDQDLQGYSVVSVSTYVVDRPNSAID